MRVCELAGRKGFLGSLSHNFGLERVEILLDLEAQPVLENRCARIAIRVFNGIIHAAA
jgi:hypothetical protein